MKKKVALVTGGLSSEAQISYKSATTVMNALDKNKYDVYLIDIHPTGWWYENSLGEEVAVDRADFSIQEAGVKINFDIALMCIHGTPGEDGKMQGYFDLIGLPYTCLLYTSPKLKLKMNFLILLQSMKVRVKKLLLQRFQKLCSKIYQKLLNKYIPL